MLPGEPDTAKYLDGNYIYTRDDPPSKIFLSFGGNKVTKSCHSYYPDKSVYVIQENQNLTLTPQGTSKTFNYFINSYKAYETFSESDFW